MPPALIGWIKLILNLTGLSLFAGTLLSIAVGAADIVEISSISKALGIGQKRSVWNGFQAFGKTAPLGILYFVPRGPGCTGGPVLR